MPTRAILFVTRLQSHMSSVEAAELYRAFVPDCAEALALARAERKMVAFAPDTAGERVRQLLEGVGRFEYVAQPEGDLGERLACLRHRSLAEGATGTVIVGSDCPSLPPQVLEHGVGAGTDHGRLAARCGSRRLLARLLLAEPQTGAVESVVDHGAARVWLAFLQPG